MRKILALSGMLTGALLVSACNIIPTPLNTPPASALKFVCGSSDKLALEGDYAWLNGNRYSYQKMTNGQAFYRYHSSSFGLKKVGENRTLMMGLDAKPCVAVK